jgi:5-(carboxyamino)imidazole ribonucleotide synthase
MSDSSVSDTQPLLPGATLGVIGGGQLGRYFVLEARRLGYHTWVLDPDQNAPAMQLAEHYLIAAYDDEEALEQLGKSCDAVTVEFENVPAKSLELLDTLCRVAPTAASIRVAQDRDLEKKTAQMYGLTPVPYATILNLGDIAAAAASVEFPAILKTSRLGYDGKGQHVCHNLQELMDAFDAVGQAECVLEQRIDLLAEVSVVLARRSDGETAVFPLSRNVHVGGVLSTSTVPSGLDNELLSHAENLARKLADGLNYVGVLAVEFFIERSGKILFNEMAPRPHNSGHYTLDATVTSQFEQQLRALCNLPLGDTMLLSPVCMTNILGDVWSDGDPDWLAVLNQSGAQLHLYGKSEARAGRKMGHINCLSETSEQALHFAQEIHSKLVPGK